VTFYLVGNAANGNFNTSGDTIYTISQSAQAATALTDFASVSAASFAGSIPLAANEIVAGFGTGLAQNTLAASAVPLPTSLDGTSVFVNGVAAGLFFVSPNQINYLVPAGTANGAATVTVRRNGVDIAQGTPNVETAAPGLFSANSSGTGVAVALLFRRRAGVDTLEPVAQFNTTASRFDPAELDLGPDTDLVLLVAFGTGFRNAAATSATIGGTAASVLFVGPAPGFEGLDQVNISIPRSLIGRKLVDVVFTANGRQANTVQISVK
jgi:uncharacterized protein (TIGR03437 family)